MCENELRITLQRIHTMKGKKSEEKTKKKHKKKRMLNYLNRDKLWRARQQYIILKNTSEMLFFSSAVSDLKIVFLSFKFISVIPS